ncbi:nicotinamide-nucleotide amidase [Atopostipes suicloacalis DSM 15692]|uniref:Putative competence-damage inducible protein n=1 Tax=Atopostipes suicloacalis DSM 15692 TaxID=1121025 RepID=A0A1M4YNI6_9LACT|nr:CinA family nicotinamide mononucleotide deamidase-related protein [Atopostipes suicloacalis]SHF07375.1 nicotinamide-nucleotide amidase [Atopostipes suicloacalis DSM 15692]
MKAEIITSGTELLLGEVVDTNTPFLARELAAIGINVYHHTTVGDNPARLLDAIQLAEKRADIIIISGGLGPTEDDITKMILAKHLNVELTLDEESLHKVNRRYQTEKLSKGNYQQAQILKGSQPLKNDIGMAAGIYMEKEDHTYVLLPGVPSEFEYMVEDQLIPFLMQNTTKNNILRSRNLNFYGLPEAKVAEELADLIHQQTNPTLAIYAKEGIIDVRITSSGQTEAECTKMLDEMEKRILKQLDQHFISYNSTRIQDVIFEQLAMKAESLALVEVNTDGEVIDSLAHELEHKELFKGGLYFTQHVNAANYFNLETLQENKKEQNEKMANKIREEFQSDYGLAVTGWGENQRSYKPMPEQAFISIAKAEGEVFTHEIDLTKRTYFARWLLALKVSDTLRRFLLDLPQLEEE